MSTASSNNASEYRLAVYGTLARVSRNHRLVADLGGRWLEGSVRGHLVHAGWGAALGYPGLTLDDDGGGQVQVWVLDSSTLPTRWDELDEFAGPGYQRSEVVVATHEGDMLASIYLVADRLRA